MISVEDTRILWTNQHLCGDSTLKSTQIPAKTDINDKNHMFLFLKWGISPKTRLLIVYHGSTMTG